jgi:hypothetical protein
MQYVPPLRVLARLGSIKQTETEVTLPREAIHALLRAAFTGPAFDAAWYRKTYTDVAAAIAEGLVPDEISHFVRFGYFEGRRPRAFTVDTAWYEGSYADVAAAIRTGAVADAAAHFNSDGYLEPRAPTPEVAAVYGPLLDAANSLAAASLPERAPAASAKPPASQKLRRRQG